LCFHDAEEAAMQLLLDQSNGLLLPDVYYINKVLHARLTASDAQPCGCTGRRV